MLRSKAKLKISGTLCLLAVLALGVSGPLAAGQETNPPNSVDDKITVSLDVESVNVRDVIRGLAQQAGANIAIAESVQGTITINMKDVPWDRAFDAVLKTAGLFGQRDDDFIIVKTLSEESTTPEESTTLEGIPKPPLLGSKVFSFEFADAESLQGAFRALSGPLGHVALDKQANSLIVAGSESTTDKLTALAVEAAAPPKRILIEVLIADTILTDEKDIGINWEAIKSNNRSVFGLGQDLIDTAGGGGTVSYNVLNSRWTATNFLRALQQFKNTRILATPKILVLSGREASIETIEEIPYQELTQTGAGGQIGTTAFKEAGVKLKVMPKVTDDGRIFLTVNAEQSAATGESVNDVPVISSRTADTTLLLTNNETLVIGGLRRKESVKTVSQVPLLGDIPLLGALFRYTSTVEENRDLVIFLTPHLVEETSEFTEWERENMDKIGYPNGSKQSVYMELESKVNGMAKDIQEGDLPGIRRRIVDLRNRLQHDHGVR